MAHPPHPSSDHVTPEATSGETSRRRIDGVDTDLDNPVVDTASEAVLLTSEQVDRIRLRHEGGESLSALASEFKTTYDSLLQFVVRRW
ncbi:MAG: hypothetical protein WC054_12815 [Candidatus Nanopelagicales bacterium]